MFISSTEKAHGGRARKTNVLLFSASNGCKNAIATTIGDVSEWFRLLQRVQIFHSENHILIFNLFIIHCWLLTLCFLSIPIKCKFQPQNSLVQQEKLSQIIHKYCFSHVACAPNTCYSFLNIIFYFVISTVFLESGEESGFIQNSLVLCITPLRLNFIFFNSEKSFLNTTR